MRGIRGKHVWAPDCSSSRLLSVPIHCVMKLRSVQRLAESVVFCHMDCSPGTDAAGK